MDTRDAIRPTGKRPVVHTVLPVLVILIGVAGLAYMITVEDEPGAVPLLLIASGIGWLVVARVRTRPRRD